MVFRGRFRSRIVILVLLVLALLYNSDKIASFVKGDESGLSQAHKLPSINDNQALPMPDTEQNVSEEFSEIDALLTEHLKKMRHNNDVNNKNPVFRKEIEEIEDMLKVAQNKIHKALQHQEHKEDELNPVVDKPDIKPNNSNIKFEEYDFTQGEPKDPDVKAKRDTVRDMMKHAWRGYREKAWTENEVRPISGKGHSANIFGNAKTGATIVDALDTLWIMGLTIEFNQGRDWVKESFKFNSKTDVSVFETVIRFVGGFIAAGTMSGDPLFYDKAIEVADLLQGAFNTKSGIPMALINPSTKKMKNWNWASNGCSILAEIGTLHLEYSELSNYSNDKKYLNSVMNVRNILQSMDRPDRLYPNYINPNTKKWGQKHVSVGGLGDSFYEYLIKTYVYTNKKDSVALEMYKDALQGIEKSLVKKSAGGLTYIGEYKSGRVTATMAHLTCFAGGMIALGAQSDPNISSLEQSRQMELAADVTNSCHESYDRSPSKLGPESFRFDLSGRQEATQTRSNDAYYILRPEVVESYFYMWRYTKDQKYRDWAWEAVKALEEHCKAAHGYTGLKNVNSVPPVKDDLQQSFFLAETLKYLYLIFSEDELISLDEFVFNTEAHPMRIQK